MVRTQVGNCGGGGRAADRSRELPLAKVENFDRVIIRIRNEA